MCAYEGMYMDMYLYEYVFSRTNICSDMVVCVKWRRSSGDIWVYGLELVRFMGA